MRNKDVIIKNLIESITDSNKKRIAQSFSYNQYVTENSNKDINTKIGMFNESIQEKYLRKVFKNGPSKIWGKQPLKNLKGYGLPKPCPSYPFKFFKGCLPQVLLGSHPFKRFKGCLPQTLLVHS